MRPHICRFGSSRPGRCRLCLRHHSSRFLGTSLIPPWDQWVAGKKLFFSGPHLARYKESCFTDWSQSCWDTHLG